MGDYELPEDTRVWPTDPFQLLNVARGADQRTIKTAYTRLIRRFKPEYFPVQFRMLREAYDAISKPATTADWQWSDIQRIVAPTPPESSLASVQAESVNSQLEEAWVTAKRGDIVGAMDRLRSIPSEGPHLATARLLDYWLTKLQNPDPYDDAGARVLIANLHRWVGAEELLEIADGELRHHPSLAELIDLDACSIHARTYASFLRVLDLRWNSALRLGDLSIVRSDCKTLSQTYFDQRERRETILIRSIHYLIWSEDAEDISLATELQSELESISGLRYGVSQALTEIDLGRQLAKMQQHCLKHNRRSSSILKLVPLMWNDMELDYAKPVMRFLVDAMNGPKEALLFLEFVSGTEPLCRYLINKFEQVIMRYASMDDPTELENRINDDIKAQSQALSGIEITWIESFLEKNSNYSYDIFRLLFLDFCVDKYISIPRFAKYAVGSSTVHSRFFRSRFSGYLREDTCLIVLGDLLHKLNLATSANIPCDWSSITL